MRMTKCNELNGTIFVRKDCVLGFNRNGMLKVGKEGTWQKDRKWTYYLGSIDGEQYYWQRRELPKRRTNLFV